ncbi:MAG: aryl-sulfate sulfotransferase [Bacteroidota bacterium]
MMFYSTTSRVIGKLSPYFWITAVLCIALGPITNAQRTVGLLSYTPSKSFEGYNLLYPHNQADVFLLNNCGEIVHRWEDEPDFRPGNMAYIQENGDLIKCKRSAFVADDPIWAGGGGDIVEIRDWDNQLKWSFALNDSLSRLHHDIAPMPDGHILMIVWERKTREEAIQAGRDTSQVTEGELWPDYIIEVDPETDQIVWEWHAWDHLIQDFDETKDNFGNVADHPELIDINWQTNDGGADWMHSNAIDYQAENKLILLSVPTFHEVWVIDKSTTTEEAAGHIGGFGKRGGDLLYRWGNPAAYRAGTETDQQLFYQHDAHWVDDFLTNMHPQFGKIAVFNNRVAADVSTVNTFEAGFDMYNWGFPFSNGTYEPAGFDYTYTHPTPSLIHSTGLSSVQFLPNGNALICAGRWGYSLEVTPDNEIVWEYKTPLRGGAPVTQGDSLAINNNLTFRLKRYPTNFEAFDNRDLSPNGYIELNPDTSFCQALMTNINEVERYDLSIAPNPAHDRLAISWERGYRVALTIYDALGRVMTTVKGSGGRTYVDTSTWQEGLYFVRINDMDIRSLVILR